jgi:hypothetical protein
MNGERIGPYPTLVGIPGGRENFEDLDVDGKVILIWIFKTCDMKLGLST